jgi:hypothetical protein
VAGCLMRPMTTQRVRRASNALHRALHVVPEDGLCDENGLVDFNAGEAELLREAIDTARPLVDEARPRMARVRLLVI